MTKPTEQAARPPSKRKRVKMAIDEMRRAGQLLSNVAWNLARSHQLQSLHDKRCCEEASDRWDRAVHELVEAQRMPR